MRLLNAAYLPPGSGHRQPCSKLRRVGGGRLTSAHSERHATQDFGSKCPFARQSTLSSLQRTCNNPPWGHETGTRMRSSPDPTAESFGIRSHQVHDASASSPALPCWMLFALVFCLLYSRNRGSLQYCQLSPSIGTPRSVTPSYEYHWWILGSISVRRDGFRRCGPSLFILATPNRLPLLSEPPCTFYAMHSMRPSQPNKVNL